MDINLALAIGSDIPIPECQLTLHQPTIKEISYLGENTFFSGMQCLMINKTMFISEDKSDLDTLNNFQIFMTIMSSKEGSEKKNQVQQVLSLLFPNYKVNILPRSIVFLKDGETIMMDEKNFEVFQNVARQVFCANSGPMDQQSFNPANETAKKIAEKLMRGRQRVAAQKSGGKSSSVFGQYVSILSVGLHAPIQMFTNYTMYMLYDTLERFSLFMNWDMDIKVRLAGGKPDSQPDNWMKSLH